MGGSTFYSVQHISLVKRKCTALLWPIILIYTLFGTKMNTFIWNVCMSATYQPLLTNSLLVYHYRSIYNTV